MYKKAVGLFDIPEYVSTTWIKWNEWILFGRSLTEWGKLRGEDIYGVYLRNTRVVYGLQVAVRLGERPFLTCVKKAPRVVMWEVPSELGFGLWKSGGKPPEEIYYADCPGENASKVVMASVTWEVLRNGSRLLCMNWWVFWQYWWYDWGGYGYLNYEYPPPKYSACTKRDAPPRNITAVAGKNAF